LLGGANAPCIAPPLATQLKVRNEFEVDRKTVNEQDVEYCECKLANYFVYRDQNKSVKLGYNEQLGLG